MQIECSSCGAKQRFKYSAENVNSLIAFGWNSIKHNLYCPKYVEKLSTRFNYPLSVFWSEDSTRSKIGEFAERQGVI